MLRAWGEYLWARLRRQDYWNPAHIITNPPKYLYRPHGPAAGMGAPVPTVMRKEAENIYNARYFHRDVRRRDVGFYPDTPLSLNHQLMKGKPLRPDSAPGGHLPRVGVFGNKEHATMKAANVMPSKGLPFEG